MHIQNNLNYHTEKLLVHFVCLRRDCVCVYEFWFNKDVANMLRKWKSCEGGVRRPPLVNQSNGEFGQAQFLEREQGHVASVHSGERMAEPKVTSDGNKGGWWKRNIKDDGAV